MVHPELILLPLIVHRSIVQTFALIPKSVSGFNVLLSMENIHSQLLTTRRRLSIGYFFGGVRAPTRKVAHIQFNPNLSQGCQMAKFGPFLSLDCARVEGVGRYPRKGRDQFLQRSVEEP